MEKYGYYVANTEGKQFEPCPFCGGNMQEIYETGIGASVDSFYYKYIVFCDCGAMMSGTAHVRSAKEVDRKSVISDHAKRTWNRRK